MRIVHGRRLINRFARRVAREAQSWTMLRVSGAEFVREAEFRGPEQIWLCEPSRRWTHDKLSKSEPSARSS